MVARRDHPLQRARPTPGDLVRSPWLDWLDGYRSARTGAGARGPSFGAVLERLHERTGERPGPVFLAGAAAGLRLLAEGPWLSWFPFTFLARSPELGLKPLPLTFGRRRYRTGLVARRSAEDLAPVRLLEDLVRDIADRTARLRRRIPVRTGRGLRCGPMPCAMSAIQRTPS